MEPFKGFPKAAFTFLAGLRKNNNKGWFDAQRSAYEDHCLAPAKAFVEAIGPRLRKLSPAINFEPRVNGSIFRMNRDVRFSKDKTPYKTTLDMWFWEGGKKGWDSPGFFLRLTPKAMIAGAGMHQFATPQLLQAYRAAVLAPKSGELLERVIKNLGSLHLGEATRKTVPKGFDEAHARSWLLLHQGLHASIEKPLPRTVHSAAFVETCFDIFRQAAPISKWLRDHVVK
jgi:uncharacterized protein (TIGR02453 family)